MEPSNSSHNKKSGWGLSMATDHYCTTQQNPRKSRDESTSNRTNPSCCSRLSTHKAKLRQGLHRNECPPTIEESFRQHFLPPGLWAKGVCYAQDGLSQV